jgi:glycosyltransferase involved in cell wall biosynthesis
MASDRLDSSVLLSAIIPVGGFPNGFEALESWILNCSHEKLEIIFVLDTNDFATTSFIVNISKILTKTSFKVLRCDSRNPGSARNIGIKGAKGKWICFWDADDVPDFVNVLSQIESKANQPADIIVGNYQVIDFETKSVVLRRLDKKDPMMSIAINPGLWRFIFKREILEKATFPALRMGEDQVFIFSTLTNARNINFVDDNFYSYYQYQTGQLTKSVDFGRDLVETRDICKKMFQSSKSRYLRTAIIRQDFTLVKRGSLTIKTNAIYDLTKLVFQSIRNPYMIIAVFLRVLDEK